MVQFEPPCTVDDSWIACVPGRRTLISFANSLNGNQKKLDDFARTRQISNFDWLNLSELCEGQILDALEKVVDRIKVRMSSEKEQQYIRKQSSNKNDEENVEENVNVVALQKCLDLTTARIGFQRLRINLKYY